MNNTKLLIIFNWLIFTLTILGLVILFGGFEFMQDLTQYGAIVRNLSIFKYYTIQSNVLMAIISLIYVIFIQTKKQISFALSLLKFVATVAVTLTFITVVFYLAPISKDGYFSAFANANLFFHFVIPVLSIITFVAFENHSKLQMKHTIVGISTMLLYAAFYGANVFIHMENGKVSAKYDWYRFVQNGVWTVVIVFPIMLLVTYLISFVLLKLQKKLH